MHPRMIAAALLLALPAAAACRHDEALSAPNLDTSNGLLQRYVAMGNSITAGFQSAGINDSTQRLSYAVIFARQAGTAFNYPALSLPGCPAPFTVNATQTRLGGTSASACAFRAADPTPSTVLNNVAVPGARVVDAWSNFDPSAAPSPLTTFILGGRSQVQAMQQAQPTFVSVWLGNNDVLGALTNTANPGNPALVTPQPAFEAAYGAILDSVEATGARAALITVADVGVIPYATQGSVYWCLDNAPACGFPAPAGFPAATLTVDISCAPLAAVPIAKGDSSLIPWIIGVPKLAAAQAGLPQTIDCTADTEVVTAAEYKVMRDAVQGYNAYITAQAAARGWALLDVNPALLAARTNPALVTNFPNLPTAASGGNVTFGSYFSLDGVHPSSLAHRVIADSLISAVNRTYATTIPFAR